MKTSYKLRKFKDYTEAVEFGIDQELRREEILYEDEQELFIFIDPKKVLTQAISKLKGKADIPLLQSIIKLEVSGEVFSKRKYS